MKQRVPFQICRCPQRQFFHQVGAQNRQACLTEEPASNPTGLPRRARDYSIDIHAELLDRRARGHNPQFQARVIALEFGEAGNKPAHREGRQRRYLEQPTGSPSVLHPLRHSGQTIKCRAGLGEQLRPRLGGRGVTAGAQEKANAEPLFEQADLAAHGPMGDVELVRRMGEAAEPCGSLEGLDRIQRR
jgi:hypothetical protein